MKSAGRRGIHYMQKLHASNVPKELVEKGQNRVIEASLTLIRERAKLKGELVRALGGAVASTSLLGVPLGHNSSFLQGPAFAPPRIREAMWCGSTNSTTEEGKELDDPRILTDVGDVPVQELRDAGVDDDRLMSIISESVKLVMEENPLRPLVLGGDHSISYPVVRAVSEKLGGPIDILHLDAHPDIYHAFEGNKYSHASSFARIMEGGYARRLLQVGIRSINKEGREQGKRFGVEQYEMRTFSQDRQFLENLKLGEGVKGWRREEIVSRDVETSFEVKERDGVEKDLLIKFEDGEDLTVYEILDAPGEVIGKSSYGTLYRASLLSIDRVTLLRFLRPACTVTMKEVVPVMELLGSLRHPNLVPLCAFYAGQRGEKLMVHPFYRHGTLAQLIRDGNGEAHKWHIICRISIGIAQGLDYLHTDLEIPIIHGNLKSNNILLDRHFMPYVSDFGLHLLLNPTAGQEMLEASAAQGYKAPELIKMREVSEETDIYSLGVILLELLTGKEPFYRKPNFDKDIYLPNAIQSAILDHRVADFYHPQILVSKTDDGQRAVNEDHVYEFLQLAVACCSPSPALRPTIKQVLSKLEEIGK